MNSKIGILGGSFDPVHNGHLNLGEHTRRLFHLDRVVFVPAFLSPFKKDRTQTSAEHRLKMLQLAILNRPGFEVSDIELRRGGVSYTVDTLEILARENPGADFHLIMGLDTFLDFPRWRKYERILELSHLLVSTRPGFSQKDGEHALQKMNDEKSSFTFRPESVETENRVFRCPSTGRLITFYSIPPLDISSSAVRDALRNHQSVKKMLPPEVEEYIMTHRLYQTSPHPPS